MLSGSVPIHLLVSEALKRLVVYHRPNVLIYSKTVHVYEPFHEKTNIMDSALCIDPDQPAQFAQANPGRHIPY